MMEVHPYVRAFHTRSEALSDVWWLGCVDGS